MLWHGMAMLWHTHIVRDRFAQCAVSEFQEAMCCRTASCSDLIGGSMSINGPSVVSSLDFQVCSCSFRIFNEFNEFVVQVSKNEIKNEFEGKTPRHSVALSLFRHAKLLRKSKKCKGLELNMILLIYIYTHRLYIYALYIYIIQIYYTIAFQFRSKSANFTLTLPAEAVPLVPIGGLKGPLVRFGQ